MKDPAVVRGAVVAVALVVAITFPTATQSPPARAAQPIEPIGAIIDAFRSHSVVALGEDHGNEQGHAFRIRLLRDPRFTATVNDIVVEFGNPRYQELMDRFVKGEQIGDQALRRVWQDTTQISGVWDRPIYEDFFRAVRAVNATLPRERQLRVLLGDLPVDWDAVRRSPPKPGEKRLLGQPVRDDAPAGAMDRDRHAAEVIQREILAKQRRALLIFGDMHVTRRPTSIVGRLESRRRRARLQYQERHAPQLRESAGAAARCRLLARPEPRDRGRDRPHAARVRRRRCGALSRSDCRQ